MQDRDARDRLIVALDASPADATRLAGELQGLVDWVKVGMTLFYQSGPGIVAELAGMGFKVFLDLKLHDIPHQVEGAAASVAGLGAGMLTVHASGGPAMVEAAMRGAADGARAAGVVRPAVIAVTVLTSMSDEGLSGIGVARTVSEQVERLSRMAYGHGADGVVCSPLEAHAVRGLLGSDALIVTPGVRPSGAEKGDQSRVMTPAQAVATGADRIVVGRPITEAVDPAQAVAAIIAEMEASQ